ncbi:MAG: hypothetical protein QG625_3805 [Cyanobacteriota bacterium erpe_2018_sw_39hr_WHONDRS-SW48-000098_B_bin.30]|jgi:hypothetical protein|nr:hypothetical protein [Cyanobacteriota bacterium erpe_2018_sw_39hr_WHONDRS-SW48-000098_B_bin.30]
MSQYHYVTDEQILECISTGASFLRACRRDEKSCFAVISASSDLTSPVEIAKLLAVLRAAGLKPCVYSPAGLAEIHIYIYFARSVDSEKVNSVLANLLTQGSESFLDKGFRILGVEEQISLPLQSGFAWLNDDLGVRLLRDQICLEAALAMIMSEIAKNSVDPDYFLCLFNNETVAPAHDKSLQAVDILPSVTDVYELPHNPELPQELSLETLITQTSSDSSDEPTETIIATQLGSDFEVDPIDSLSQPEHVQSEVSDQPDHSEHSIQPEQASPELQLSLFTLTQQPKARSPARSKGSKKSKQPSAILADERMRDPPDYTQFRITELAARPRESLERTGPLPLNIQSDGL